MNSHGPTICSVAGAAGCGAALVVPSWANAQGAAPAARAAVVACSAVRRVSLGGEGAGIKPLFKRNLLGEPNKGESR
jgi:tetrahydromethanopterin S-methyltransferase subunit C